MAQLGRRHEPATAGPAMADVRDMYLMHDTLRREFRLMPGLFRGVAAGDTKRAAVVATHAGLLCRLLHVHHEAEDAILWPKLRERAGTQATVVVAAMEQQHAAIDAALTRAAELIPIWRATTRRGANLADVFDHLFSVLVEHTVMEEEQILPLAKSCVTAQEWKQMAQHGMHSFSPKDMLLCFGLMMHEGDPDVVKGALDDAPLAGRILIPRLGKRVFAAHAKRVHGAPSPSAEDR